MLKNNKIKLKEKSTFCLSLCHILDNLFSSWAFSWLVLISFSNLLCNLTSEFFISIDVFFSSRCPILTVGEMCLSLPPVLSCSFITIVFFDLSVIILNRCACNFFKIFLTSQASCLCFLSFFSSVFVIVESCEPYGELFPLLLFNFG